MRAICSCVSDLREQARRTETHSCGASGRARDRAPSVDRRGDRLRQSRPRAGPLAVGAVELRTLSEIAALHEVPLSTESLEMVGRQMAQHAIQG